MKTLVLGVIGADVHAVGNKILDHAFTEAGYKVVNLGVMVSQDEFIKAAIETNADAIMVLDHGRIVERGDHDDLIRQHGLYYQLYTGAFELE